MAFANERLDQWASVGKCRRPPWQRPSTCSSSERRLTGLLTGICAVLGFCLGRHLVGSPGERPRGCEIHCSSTSPAEYGQVGNRSVRDRILTPFVAANVTASEAESFVVAMGCRDDASLQDRRALLAPVLSTVEELQIRAFSSKSTSAFSLPSSFQEFEVQSSRERLRSSRDRTAQRKNTEVWQVPGSHSPGVTRNSSAPICRMPTPHVSSEMIEDSARLASYCNAVPMGCSYRYILLRGN